MATSVTLPALGESVTEGTVTRWLKQEGDTVEADEPLLEVSTDKVDTEIPSPAAGTLLSIKVQEDETVEVGAELAVIGDAADAGSGDGDAAAPTGGGDDSDADAAAVDVTSDAGSAGEQAEGGASGQTAQETSEPIGVSTGTADSGSADAAGGSSSGGSSSGGSSSDGSSSGGSSSASSSSGSSSSGGSDTGVSVTLPALGESVTEGTVTRWLKQEGDTVEADEPLLEVSTDKVDTEIPSPAAGTLLSIKVQEDETVEVGAVLAVIGSPGQGSDASGDGGAAAASGDASGVPMDEKPAAVEEKALAEQQESRIEAESSGSAPAEAQPSGGTSSGDTAAASASSSRPSSEGGAATSPSRADGPDGERQTSTAPSATPEPSKAPAQSSAAAGAAPSASADGAGDSAAGDTAYVTPLVRKLAADAGISLTEISGSGVGGRIRKQDVLEAAAARESAAAKAAADAEAAKASAGTAASSTPAGAAEQPTASPSSRPSGAPGASASLRGQTVKMTRMRAFIAKRMVESLQVSAQLTTVVEVDVTQIARLRNQAKAGFQAREGVKLSFLPFFAKAAIEALREYPTVNSSINAETNEVTYHGAEHLGIAVDTERGLIVPVIHDAGDLNIGGLARKIADLAERTRTNKIAPDELAGGTFTLTNTGSRGALFDTPILNQPQVGILGTGAVVKRPVVIDDPRLGETIVVRSMVYLALTYDHRIVDGADAARFLVYMKQRLEEGQFEADLGL